MFFSHVFKTLSTSGYQGADDHIPSILMAWLLAVFTQLTTFCCRCCCLYLQKIAGNSESQAPQETEQVTKFRLLSISW